MSDWTDGYVAEINYTYGYYGELNPLRMAAPLLNSGLLPPAIGTACELGFGQGICVNIHAAASGVRWYGTDFNPTHAAFAQSLAAASGSGAQLFDQSFVEFCARTDLPEFDYIALHGIWSWISQENRQIIVDFIRRKLKVGGLVYVSYNCQPGYAAMLPFRDLMMLHAEVMFGQGRGIVARIDGALDFADKLLALNPIFALTNPTIAERTRAIMGLSRHYLAHEFFNRDWQPVLFADMVESLAPAKLSYAGSAHYLDHVEALNLTPEQQKFLADIPDALFRQSARDFIVNQQFRRDYWVKGARRLQALEQAEAIRRIRIMLLAARGDVTFTVSGALGQREMTRNVYEAILDALGEREPKTIGDIERTLAGAGVGLSIIFEAVMVLAGKGDIVLVQEDERQEQAKPHCDRLNLAILDKARGGGELQFLASPVTGGGVGLTRFYQLFMLVDTAEGWPLACDSARGEAMRSSEPPISGDCPSGDDLKAFSVGDLGEAKLEQIAAQGHRVLREGKPLEAAQDNLAELSTEAREFIDKRLPMLQALKMA